MTWPIENNEIKPIVEFGSFTDYLISFKNPALYDLLHYRLFFRRLTPAGVPTILALIAVPIERVSYISRHERLDLCVYNANLNVIA